MAMAEVTAMAMAGAMVEVTAMAEGMATAIDPPFP
jgi:hypothetical protein